jgi:hypothetical protein
MRTISRVRRQTNLCAIATWLAFAQPAHAYNFTLGDLRTEMQIVQDYAAGTLAHAALSEQALQGIEHPWGPPNSVQILKSRLLEVCPTLSVTNEYGHQFQFRSKHEGGSADWIVTTPLDRESQIIGIFIAVTPGGADNKIGAPTALPWRPPGAEMKPPTDLCLSPQKVILLEQRQKEACEEWPTLCEVR